MEEKCHFGYFYPINVIKSRQSEHSSIILKGLLWHDCGNTCSIVIFYRTTAPGNINWWFTDSFCSIIWNKCCKWRPFWINKCIEHRDIEKSSPINHDFVIHFIFNSWKSSHMGLLMTTKDLLYSKIVLYWTSIITILKTYFSILYTLQAHLYLFDIFE